MQKFTFHIVFLFGLFFPLLGWGQLDSIVQLVTVEVSAEKIRQLPVGSPSEEWKGASLDKVVGTQVASLLSEETGTYIKSYGMGSLSTSSIRGGSGGHTLVLWNGLPVQSPMLGLLDLSFLPIQGAENISFQKGGNTALWGSGAIGGLISLNNEADFNNRLAVENQTTIGSFGYWQQLATVKLGNKNLQSSTKFFYEKGENDFEYEISPTLPKRQQTNADFRQRNILQDLYWQLNPANQITFHFWRQDIHRAIPPTNVQTRSVAFQDDWSNRAILNWKHHSTAAIWNFKTGYFDEYQDFINDLIRLQAHNHFRSIFGEITRQWTWRQQQLLLGSTHTYTRAWSENYSENISENKTALFFSWKWQKNNFALQSSLRQELIDQELAPLVPVLGMQYTLTPALQFQFKISRNYRLPTLNDRYWQPGGTITLLPESGWSEEVTIETNKATNNWQVTASITAFNRQIDNWILWTIPQGQQFWSAHNLTKVWSRGLEPRFSFSFTQQDFQLQFKGGYDYIRSTNQVALENPRIAQGDQLIYTPIHQAFGKINAQWKGFFGSYHHQFTGKTQGINDPIPAFQVGTIRLQYHKQFQRYQSRLFINIQNIWDTNYVIIERRPMAGRHYQVGVQLSIQRTNDE